jgi:hypothetical protein
MSRKSGAESDVSQRRRGETATPCRHSTKHDGRVFGGGSGAIRRKVQFRAVPTFARSSQSKTSSDPESLPARLEGIAGGSANRAATTE